jgi:hypothetical protein
VGRQVEQDLVAVVVEPHRVRLGKSLSLITPTTAVTGSSSSRRYFGSRSARLATSRRSPTVNCPGWTPAATSRTFATVIDMQPSSDVTDVITRR